MRCICCNHRIWVRESVERKMGPVCAANKGHMRYVAETKDIINNLMKVSGASVPRIMDDIIAKHMKGV